MSSDNNASKLAHMVCERRIALGMRTAKALADKSGISVRILSDIENGRRSNFSRTTLQDLDTGLQWQFGSSERVLQGGEPKTRELTRAEIENLGDLLEGKSKTSDKQSAPAPRALVVFPDDAVDGFEDFEVDEVLSAARNAGLQRAREIRADKARLGNFVLDKSRLADASSPDNELQGAGNDVGTTTVQNADVRGNDNSVNQNVNKL